MKDKWANLVKYPEKNFPEDYQDENGNYQNWCVVCQEVFMGNKHRNLCKQCDREVITQGMSIKIGIANL